MPTPETWPELTLRQVVETLNDMHWTVIPSFLSLSPQATANYLAAVKGWADEGNISPAMLRVRVVSASTAVGCILNAKFFVYPTTGPGGMVCRYSVNRDHVGTLETHSRERYAYNDFNSCVDAFECYCDEMPEEDGWAEDCAICDYGVPLVCREHATVH